MSDTNASGITPLEFKVLVKPRAVEEKTKGGILLPEQVRDQEKNASMEGEYIAASPLAFNYDETGSMEPPKTGDTVVFARYSGINVKGRDGIDYRIMNDKDIVAVRRSA